MDLGLRGKTALVTGGSKGIGLACAKALAREGARLAIVSRTQTSLDQALAEIDGAIAGAADLRDEKAAAGVIRVITDRLGPIDILINSAGAANRVPPDELTPAHWRAAMEAKYFSYINVIDPVLKQMAQRGSGVIINIIGSGGKLASPTHIAGGAANAALMLATAGLAAAYASRGVRVIGLNPGPIETERVERGLIADARLHGINVDDARQKLLDEIPMGRLGSAEEIADMAAFLASPRASYVTGVNISMDGAAAPVVV